MGANMKKKLKMNGVLFRSYEECQDYILSCYDTKNDFKNWDDETIRDFINCEWGEFIESGSAGDTNWNIVIMKIKNRYFYIEWKDNLNKPWGISCFMYEVVPKKKIIIQNKWLCLQRDGELSKIRGYSLSGINCEFFTISMEDFNHMQKYLAK